MLYDFEIGYYGLLDSEKWQPETFTVRAVDFGDAFQRAELKMSNIQAEIVYIRKLNVSKNQLSIVPDQTG